MKQNLISPEGFRGLKEHRLIKCAALETVQCVLHTQFILYAPYALCYLITST